MPRKSEWSLQRVFEMLVSFAKESNSGKSSAPLFCANAIARLEKETQLGSAYLRTHFLKPLREANCLIFSYGGGRGTKITGVEMNILDWEAVKNKLPGKISSPKNRAEDEHKRGAEKKEVPRNPLKLAAVGFNFDKIVAACKSDTLQLFERMLELAKSKCRVNSLDICASLEKTPEAREFLSQLVQGLADQEIPADVIGFRANGDELDREIEKWLTASAKFPGVEKVLTISAGSNFANLKKLANDLKLELEEIDLVSPEPTKKDVAAVTKPPPPPLPTKPPEPVKKSNPFLWIANSLIQHGKSLDRDSDFLVDIIRAIAELHQKHGHSPTEGIVRDHLFANAGLWFHQKWYCKYQLNQLRQAVDALVEKELLIVFEGKAPEVGGRVKLISVNLTNETIGKLNRRMPNPQNNLPARRAGGLERVAAR